MNMRLAIMSKKRFFSILHTFLLLGLQHLSMTNGMPNPKLDPISCNGDSTTTRICDPNFALSMNEKHRIQQYIGWFEQLNVTCHEQVVGVQMGVVVVGSMHSPRYNSDLGNLARKNAQKIHNDWGIGYQTSCGGTGLLLYLAVEDRQIYISRGRALTRILDNGRLQYVIEQMKPDLRNYHYGRALEVAINLITKFARGQRPDRDQALKDLQTRFCFASPFIALVFASIWYSARHIQHQKRLRQEFRGNLSKLDRDHARALQGQYKATSCPICLEDFTHKHNVNNEKAGLLDGDEELLGSDGRPLALLSCGHVFDKTCFDDLACHPTSGRSSEGGLLCPICRAPMTPQESTPATTPRMLDEPSYRDERNFRLHRLRERYPTFTGPHDVYRWYDPNYSGSLLGDYERMERERLAEARAAAARREAERRAHNNDASGWSSSDWGGTSDFGGGCADGGGVGGSW